MSSDVAAPIEIIQAFLKDRDEPCPRCGYNLRNTSTATCPECGRAISLQIDRGGVPLAKAIARSLGAYLLVSILGALYGIYAVGLFPAGFSLVYNISFGIHYAGQLSQACLMMWAIRVSLLGLHERIPADRPGLVAARVLYWVAGIEVVEFVFWRLCSL